MNEPPDSQQTKPPKRTRLARSQPGQGAKKTTRQATPLPRLTTDEREALEGYLASFRSTPYPTSDDPQEWKRYWVALDQSWRTEPEIDEKRQHFLKERLAIKSESKVGVYPLKSLEPPLSRADIEWLLDTHESNGMRGPVIWSEEKQHGRQGLDLQGTELSDVNLSGLPLSKVNLSGAHLERAVLFQAELVGGDLTSAHLNEANLIGAHLEGADLSKAQLQKANLSRASLQLADLEAVQAQEAILSDAHLDRASLRKAQLSGAVLDNAFLEGADLIRAILAGARLTGAYLEGANLRWADLRASDLRDAKLKKATLSSAILIGADLRWAHLQEAILSGTFLKGAKLGLARLEGADLAMADLSGVDLREAVMNVETRLTNQTTLDEKMRVADVAWNGVSLIRANWEGIIRLGDEFQAHQAGFVRQDMREKKTKEDWLTGYEEAVRAYRQLVMVFRGQGLNEIADRYMYRAQVLQRKVFWWQMKAGKPGKVGAYLFSWLMAVVTGYGFRLKRIIITYLVLVGLFASLYFGIGFICPPRVEWSEALILSITALHGRVFSTPFMIGSPQGWVTAAEAIAGVIIEAIFVAMLLQRLFSR